MGRKRRCVGGLRRRRLGASSSSPVAPPPPLLLAVVALLLMCGVVVDAAAAAEHGRRSSHPPARLAKRTPRPCPDGVAVLHHHRGGGDDDGIPLDAVAAVNDDEAAVSGAAPPSFTRGPALIRRGGGVGASSSSSGAAALVEGLKNAAASGLASAAAKSLLQPFDAIKTVQQQHQPGGLSAGGGGGGGAATSGFLDAARALIERGGVPELYAGLAASALGSVPSIGIYYGVYSHGKRVFIPYLQSTLGSGSDRSDGSSDGARGRPMLSDDALKLLGVALAAAVGNTLASFSRVPYEVVKQKLMLGQYDGGTLALIADMFENGGFGAFFPMGGVSVQMLRDIPYAIFTLVAYEFLRDEWVVPANEAEKNSRGTAESGGATTRPTGGSPWRDMVAGAIAGGFGTFMTNGLDVIKTNLQTNPKLYGGSVATCARTLYYDGGWGVFGRGLSSRLMHKIPANALFFLFYEAFRRLLKVESAVPSAGRVEKKKTR